MKLKNRKKVLAIIPARGGSKGLPRKNMKHLLNKPLIGWTIEAAIKASVIDKVVVSSEDIEILEYAGGYGEEIPLVRPKKLALDKSTSSEVCNHALTKFPEFEFFVLLQPTSPLRNEQDIDQAFNFMLSKEADSCISICKVKDNPESMLKLYENSLISPVDKNFNKFTHRQMLRQLYRPNGAIYISSVKRFRKSRVFLNDTTVGYEMPIERSIDVDTLEDLEMARFFKRI